MKRLYAIILLIVLILMQVTIVNAKEVGTEFDARDEGVIRGLEKQKSSGKSFKSSSTELKGTGTGGTSDLNLDALGKEINNVKGGDAVDAINKVLGVVSILIVSAAIIIIMIKGVSFMQAAPEGKAEIKKDMINIVIGGILIFGINGIVGIIINIASKMF